jgi:hypothetical protein
MVWGLVIIESDHARFAKAMKEEEDRSALGFIIAEAKEQMQLLVDWRVAKVTRECNLVAYELAQLGRRNIQRRYG